MSAGRKSSPVLADADARRLAVSTFDRTVVVTAGAGTGKTALLTGRILAILMHPGEAAAEITDIAAITFTRRAAGEMRVRIREALLSFISWAGGVEPQDRSDPIAAAYLAAGSGLDPEEIRRRAVKALEGLERAPISTMHSFAGQLLREHPGVAGIDPAFSEDDGTEFDRFFQGAWHRFLEKELGENPERQELWNNALTGASLAEITALARLLADESADLEAIAAQLEDGSLFEVDSEWLGGLLEAAVELWDAHGRIEKYKPGKALGAVVRVLTAMTEGRTDFSEADLAQLGKEPASTKEWSREEAGQITGLARIALGIAGCDDAVLRSVLEAVLPFARQFRSEFARAGFLSFAALLVRARNLLRDNPAIRERVAARFRHVLVDEFQDTDPLQYEIVYFLCEQPGGRARDWRELEIQPGKLFIVGDPKQSIYSFRGADIAAYGRIVDESLAGRSLRLRLQTNFRSCDRVLDGINGMFERIIREQPLVQPPYEALSARPGGEATAPNQRLELHLVKPTGEDLFPNAAAALSGEARAIAGWLAEELRSGEPDLHPRDVAILLRKMSGVDEYVDALRAEGLPYVVEGEKSFYVTEEICTFINLLSAIVDPHDATALAGVLRSPLGGCADRDLAVLARDGALDYSCGAELPADLDDPDAVRALYDSLRELRDACGLLPLVEALDLIIDRLPVMEAAAGMRGEQAVGNIGKIRRLAAGHGDDGGIGLREFTRLLRKNTAEVTEEGENPLAEEGQDAIRILTVHKAKGLEFPVVILAGLHSGLSPRNQAVRLTSDWGSGRWGLVLGKQKTPEAVRLDAEEDARTDAEERRIFYVGATRARDRLVFSAAPTKRSNSRQVALGYIDECCDRTGGGKVLPLGQGELNVLRMELSGGRKSVPAGKVRSPSAAQLSKWSELEAARTARCAEAAGCALMLRPSATHEHPDVDGAVIEGETLMPLVGRRREGALLLGTLAHAVMEHLEFSRAGADLEETIARVMDEHSVELGEDREELSSELSRMIGTFIETDAFRDLARAEILAREIPCLLPWPVQDGRFAATEGIIDLVCEQDGRLVVVDYKTDRVAAGSTGEHARRYRQQGEIYRAAVEASTGRKVAAFRVVFLRAGIAVDL